MFTAEDSTVFALPNSYHKIDVAGGIYFPQLGGLLTKANLLIHKIYNVQPNVGYKISQTPIASKGRREDAVFRENRIDASQIAVGLRAKGQPVSLTRPNGALCQMHFALLTFSIAAMNDNEYVIGVDFFPYILKYHQKHRDDFAEFIINLKLDAILDLLDIPFQSNFDFENISDLMRKHKSVLLGPFVQGIDPSMAELAILVIIFTAMFPLIDVFTSLSNDKKPTIDYYSSFKKWFLNERLSYIGGFSVEPLKPELTRLSENQVRGFFESLLGYKYKFPTIRPDWLKSRKTKANLELDGYCEELNLAFEYQGEYHYFYVPVHHKEKTLEDIKATDELKLKICKQRGVSLIQVPHWEKDNINFIRESLLSLDRPEITSLLI